MIIIITQGAIPAHLLELLKLKANHANYGEDVEELECSHTAVGNEK